MPGRMDFEFRYAPQPEREESRSRSGPMRVLVLGDLSGRANRGVLNRDDLADRPCVRVDVDNLDDVLTRYAPRLHLPLGRGGEAAAIEFRGTEDFHPDSLYSRVHVFGALRALRQRMQDPGSAAEEAEQMRETLAASAGQPQPESDSGTLERLLGKRPAARPVARVQPQPDGFDVEGFIRKIVRPYVVTDAGAGHEHLIRAVDQATGEQMRSLLHHPDFQALEALWRQVRGFVTRLETGEMLSLHLLDATRDELAADLLGEDRSVEGSGLHRLLVQRGPETLGGEPWSLFVGAYVFGTAAADLALLAALGELAHQAGGPLLAEAAPEVLGCESLATAPDPADWTLDDAAAARRWLDLRRRPQAHWLGLALPRVLLRLPYGSRSEEIDSFAFEEQDPAPDHERYLWGNPAFVCAELIARAFLERGWSMEPGDYLEVDDLPAFAFAEAGESRLQPCAEVCLGERAGQAILERGPMPLLAYRDRPTARVLRFQSLADPPAALAGAWG